MYNFILLGEKYEGGKEAGRVVSFSLGLDWSDWLAEVCCGQSCR